MKDKEPKSPIRMEMKRHLIKKGLTFNAEVEPVYMRAGLLDDVVSAVIEYLEAGELPKRLTR